MTKHYLDIDTPALLVNKSVMEKNIQWMMEKAKRMGVKLRPHTKTHRTPVIAKLQLSAGASGITVAKVGEAEVMAAAGITDIFIANEIFGDIKFMRLRDLHRKIRIAVGVDNEEQVQTISRIFKEEAKPLDVMMEIETGEERTGVTSAEQALQLAQFIADSPGIRLRGVFSHEGHCYGAANPEECVSIFNKSQQDTLDIANYLRKNGVAVEEISIGATPSLLHGDVLSGITEIRPGTYIFMDAAQGHAINDYSRCALTVLATVLSKPTAERVVVDSGVKALTAFTRASGICHTPGYGLLKAFPELRLKKLYDEHGIIISQEANAKLKVGDKVEIIPNHVCPTCNLYDKMYVVENGNVVEEWPILCRGKSQ